MSEWDKIFESGKRLLETQQTQTTLSSHLIESLSQGESLNQKLKAISEKILIWCNDCLKPDYVCPSCIYGDIKKILGLNPNRREFLGVEE